MKTSANMACLSTSAGGAGAAGGAARAPARRRRSSGCPTTISCSPAFRPLAHDVVVADDRPELHRALLRDQSPPFARARRRTRSTAPLMRVDRRRPGPSARARCVHTMLRAHELIGAEAAAAVDAAPWPARSASPSSTDGETKLTRVGRDDLARDRRRAAPAGRASSSGACCTGTLHVDLEAGVLVDGRQHRRAASRDRRRGPGCRRPRRRRAPSPGSSRARRAAARICSSIALSCASAVLSAVGRLLELLLADRRRRRAASLRARPAAARSCTSASRAARCDSSARHRGLLRARSRSRSSTRARRDALAGAHRDPR